MKEKLRHFLLLAGLLMLAAFTFVPPAHNIPDNNRFIPEVGYEIPPVDTLTLIASNIAAPKNSVACIEVKTSDFNKILSMQYSMNWESHVLKFKEVRAFGLPAMTKNNFGAHLVEKGILTFSWYDPNLRGMTKNGETKLYEVCFDVIGGLGSQAQFSINGKPTIVEITNAAGVFLNLRTQGGLVEVK